MKEQSVVLVGIGSICRTFHIPCLKSHGVKVAHAVDISAEALAYASRQFPGISVSTSMDEIPEGVACAVVCSPTAFHYDHVLSLLQKGFHVLVEKPLACTGAQASHLKELAEKKSLVLQVGYYRRFHPSTLIASSLLRNGELGKLERCEMVGGHIARSGDMPSSMFDRALSGGGVSIDFGVHLIDRILSWFDEVSLVAYFDDQNGGVEADSQMNFIGGLRRKSKGFESPVPITIELSRTTNLGYYTRLVFERADIRLAHNVGHVIVVEGKSLVFMGRPIRPTCEVEISLEESASSFFSKQWIEFTTRINGGMEVVSSLAQAVETTFLLDECYSNRRTLELAWERQLWGEYH